MLAAFVTEATAGFGSSIISLALGSQVYAIAELVPVLVPLNLIVTGYLVARYRHHVQWRFLAARILPVMGAGAAAGVGLSSAVAGVVLERAFGGLVIALAVRELWLLARGRAGDTSTDRSLPGPVQVVVIGAAGVIHGIYATGGPLLVYALGRSSLPKTAFRATLASVWCALNIGLATIFAVTGRLDQIALGRIAYLVPVVLVALVVGERLHHRVPERPFRALVYALLLLAGAGILAG